MPRSEYFIPLPEPVGRAISDAVRAFATQMDLEAEVWIQDLPLWTLSKHDPATGLVRRLQVGAYRLDDTDEVRVIPQVLWLDKKSRSLFAPEQIDPSAIRGMRLWEVRTDGLLVLLKEAWSDVSRMAPPKNSGELRIPVSPHYRW
ncbi:MAG: hypothetical protein HY002_08075 [Candidatus Rokubacteria bacterium]|nr:hypothetical protein [Candidatus Rokubacteria bacterium]